MSERHPSPTAVTSRRFPHWPLWGALIALAAALFTLPALAGVPARLIKDCGKWIAIASVLELLSILGFVLVFRLVFGGRMSWRRNVLASLRALAVSAVLPGGGLIGPGTSAWFAGTNRPSPSRLARCTITFVILNQIPGMIVLAALGLSLWLGLPSGPHTGALTLLPAGLALGFLSVSWRVGRSPARPKHRNSPKARSALSSRIATAALTLCEGLIEARALVARRNWELAGAVMYYAFDNAVLWAAFHAYGHAPPLGIVLMGYLVGSIGAALPLPAGLGITGGLIGGLVLYGAPAAPAAGAVLLYRVISLALPVALSILASACGPVADYSLQIKARGKRGVCPALPSHRVRAEPARVD